MVLITPLRMGPIQRYRHFLYIINEKQPTFKYAIEGWLFFLVQKFVLLNIIRIFAAREPAKPLNDAQMRGAFLYVYVSSQNTLMERYISPAIESEEYVPILRVLPP